MTLEEDFTLLDGSFPELPDSPTDVVFWSDVISDSSGNFSSNPIITINFDDPHTSVGLTFYFSENYPLEMIVMWKNGSDQTISTKTVTVTGTTFELLNKVENYEKITIEFTKTNPYNFVKLWYIEYGVIYTFDESVIKTGNIVSEVDPISDKITIDTMNIEIMDKNNEFNLGNPDGIHSTFQRNQKLLPYRVKNGVTSGLGEWYLKDFSTENNILKLNSVSRIGILDNFDFILGEVYVNKKAGLILDTIFLTAGISSYMIDSVTYDTLLSGTLKKQTCRKALREVLFACGSICETHNGTIVIKKQSKTVQSTVDRSRKFSTVTTKNEYISDVSIKYNNYVIRTLS